MLITLTKFCNVVNLNYDTVKRHLLYVSKQSNHKVNANYFSVKNRLTNVVTVYLNDTLIDYLIDYYFPGGVPAALMIQLIKKQQKNKSYENFKIESILSNEFKKLWV